VSTVTLEVRANKAEVRALLRSLPAALTGKGPFAPPVQKFLTRLGLTVLGLIHDSFLRRARGGTAAGYRWKKLAAATIRKKRHTAPVNAYLILREFDDLQFSLMPTLRPADATVLPPTRPLQIFFHQPGRVILGTSRRWAGRHHQGVPGELPRRPLWPPPRDWQASWWRRLLQEAQKGAVPMIAEMLRSRP